MTRPDDTRSSAEELELDVVPRKVHRSDAAIAADLGQVGARLELLELQLDTALELARRLRP